MTKQEKKLPGSATIDRIDGPTAYLEGEGRTFELDTELLPKNAREGMVVSLKNGKYFINKEATKKSKEEAKTLLNDIFNN